MYKIEFNPQSCVWEIKLSSFFGLVWTKLKGQDFPNIQSAEDYVTDVGLDQVYKDYRKGYQHAVTHGGAY